MSCSESWQWLFHSFDLLVLEVGIYVIRISLVRCCSSPLHRFIIDDVVSMIDLCAAVIELIFCMDWVGYWYFGAAMFAVCWWWCLTWGQAAANPIKWMEDCLRGDVSLVFAVFMIVIEVIAAVATYWLVEFVWPYAFSCHHRVESLDEHCESHIQVWSILAALAECLCTFLDRTYMYLTPHLAFFQSPIVESCAVTAITLIGMYFSGGYFNPTIATTTQFGCDGHTNWDFLFVYWLAPICGALIAYKLEPQFVSYIENYEPLGCSF